ILFLLSMFIFLLIGKSRSQSTYVILTSVNDTTDNYYHAAQILSNYRNAQIIQFNPSELDSLLPVLINIEPRYVAIVIKPIELNINFVRSFLMMSTQIDIDPFSDFSYGYITGATGQDAINFVDTIIYADSHNIQDFPLNIGGYVATSLNLVYQYPTGYMEDLNPNTYSEIWLETNDNGSGEVFFLNNTGYMENNKLLDIGHNGDPHMIWLFEGGNSSPVPPVWNYDSTKIEDVAYARVGLTSYDIAGLNLYPAVAFNGACHSGEPKRVMVEGDIAATFGDIQNYIKYYTMSDTFSFALSILKTGITGYFAPCGSNNANDQGEEVYNTFLFHEPLGDIHKRVVDGVVMGFLGNRPNLSMFYQDDWAWNQDILSSGTFDPNDWSGANAMLGGKANRIYYGDPLLNPFANNYSSALNIVTSNIDSINPNTIDINVNLNKSDEYYAVCWDKFHFGNTRIYIPVELPSFIDSIASFTVISSSGPYDLVIHALEQFDGKNILHIEVDIPDNIYDSIQYDIKLRINYISTGNNQNLSDNQQILIYPNPVSENVSISGIDIYQIEIFDLSGKILKQINTKANYQKINMSNFEKGIYFFKVTCKNTVSIQKIILE
ncbi:MAG: T9SS type A sorting domain-containing protein, partial [Bacteroidota bacterium]